MSNETREELLKERDLLIAQLGHIASCFWSEGEPFEDRCDYLQAYASKAEDEAITRKAALGRAFPSGDGPAPFLQQSYAHRFDSPPPSGDGPEAQPLSVPRLRSGPGNTVEAAPDALALRRLADSVVFHQLCCLGGCHESMAALARLAKAIGFNSDPATAEEIEEALSAPHDHGKTHQCYIEERTDALTLARQRIEKLEEGLRLFLEDQRFQVAVGGNPIAVDKMLSAARALLAPAAREKNT